MLTNSRRSESSYEGVTSEFLAIHVRFVKPGFYFCAYFTRRYHPANLFDGIRKIFCFHVMKHSGYAGMAQSSVNIQWRTQKIFMGGGFQSAEIFLCTKMESMIRKNIKQAAIQYVNVVKQL